MLALVSGTAWAQGVPVNGSVGSIPSSVRGQGGLASLVPDTLGATSAAGLPDLVATDLEVSATAGAPGDEFNFECRVKNVGDEEAGRSRVGYMMLYSDGSRYRTVKLSDDRTGELRPGRSERDDNDVRVPSNAAPGTTAFLTCFADVDDDVVESQEEGNAGGIIVEFTVLDESSEPDLVVQDAEVSDRTVRPGQEIELSARVRNLTGEAGRSRLGYSIGWGSTERSLGSSSVGALGDGRSSGESRTVEVPRDAPAGRAAIVFRADYEDAVDESNESNNSAIVYVDVEGATPPDLYPRVLSVSPGSAEPGESVTVSYRVANQGTEASNGSTTTISLSTSSSGPSSADPVLASVSTPGLPGNESRDYTRAVTVPAGTRSGSYRLWVRVDAAGSAGQSNRSNDLDDRALTVEEAVSQAPDLTISAITAGASSAMPGERISVECTVRNKGTGLAVASTAAFQFAYFDAEGNDRKVIEGAEAVPALAPGTTHRVSGSVGVPDDAREGSAGVACLADSGDSNPNESDEVNNAGDGGQVALVQIVVPSGSPDLVVGGVTVSENPVEAGQTVTVSGTVENAGDADAGASTVGFYFVQDDRRERLGSQSVVALDARKSRPRSQSVRVPSWARAGEATLRMAADDERAVDEGDRETNNEGFALVTVVEPGPADLAVTALTLDRASAEPGDDIEATCSVENGGGSATGAASVRFEFRYAGGTEAFGAQGVSDLPPNRSTSRTQSGRVPGDAVPGATVVVACVATSPGDPTATDNVREATFTVEGSSTPPPPPTPPPRSAGPLRPRNVVGVVRADALDVDADAPVVGLVGRHELRCVRQRPPVR